MFRIRKTAFICGLILMLAFTFPSFAAENCNEVYGKGDSLVRLATGSPGELGLVKVLAQEFGKKYPIRLCWKKAGSGASLKLLKAKAVDLVMVHAPAAEKQAVAEGWAVKRSLIGSNEFYIVGPQDDPAKISQAAGAADAYQRIAAVKARFLSRGDNSGTHKKEMALWQKAGIHPDGDWYVVTKTFMMATLKQADAEQGYFMTDSSTWVSAKQELKNLKILFRGDPFLINTYHALGQPEGTTGGQEYAAKFIDFVVSEEGQKIIGTYGMDAYGEGLYNDAAYAEQFDH